VDGIETILRRWQAFAFAAMLALITGCKSPAPAILLNRDGTVVINQPHFSLKTSPGSQFILTPSPGSSAIPGTWIRVASDSKASSAFLVRPAGEVYGVEDSSFGAGQRIEFEAHGENQQTAAALRLEITVFEKIPDVIFARLLLTDPQPWADNELIVMATRMPKVNPGDQPLWSFQGASYEARPDWVLPVDAGYSRANYMGMNASDYGGGIPVVDLWRPDFGLALGHAKTRPVSISLPVQALADTAASLAIRWRPGKMPFERQSPLFFLMWHANDYFDALRKYAEVLRLAGWNPAASPATAFEPQWCAWGYERDFNTQQVLATLPKVKELGYKWAVLDDGWQIAEGEWRPNAGKFPRGDLDMRAFVDSVHATGLEAGIWWAPMCADPNSWVDREHPDWYVQNADGSRRLVTWWDAYYLCPAVPEVVDYHRQVVRRLIRRYGFDGIKIDGQHLNAVPPCYNPKHKHPYPAIASESVPALFAAIQQQAESLKPEVVLQLCPCGDVYSVFNLPYYNQTVSSDPTSSFQIRLKAKTQKALLGDARAYYGDHVELSDHGDDFASTIGVGGVIGTKFTWPDRGPDAAILLTPQREREWAKWSAIYYRENLPSGTYLNLYDIGYDRPEGHAIARGDTLYYAFFADSFSGTIELRGLVFKSYSVTNYETGEEMGTVTGPMAEVEVGFRHHLLIKARP